MKEDVNLGRRGFLKAVGAAGTAAVAGCAGGDDQNSTETTSEEYTTGTKTTTQEEVEEELSDGEIESLLEETAYELHDDLYMNGFEGDHFKMVHVGEPISDGDNYRLRIGVDIESLFHKSGEKDRRPDLHTATKLGLEDEVMEDASSELYELSGLINENLDSFYEEAGPQRMFLSKLR